MAIKKQFKNDSYFNHDIEIFLAPHEVENKTDITLYEFDSEGSVISTWWVTIPFATKSPEEALEEVKKEEYITQGYSEAY